MSLLQTPARFARTLRPRALWVGGLVLALCGVAVLAVGRPSADAKASKAAAPPAAALEFADADIFRVQVQPLARTLALSGTLVPQVQASVKATIPGLLRTVLVREGETVRQGAVIAEIDTTDAQARLEAAQADQAERRARLAMAERNRTTNRALLQQNFISQNAFDQLTSTYQASEAALHWADAQVKLARKALEDAVVRAPIAGMVAKRLVQGGERVSPEAPLVLLVDLTRLELEATVPASEVAAIAVGQGVQFAVDGFETRRFQGRIDRINPVAEAGSRAIKVFVSVPNPDSLLRGGMFAQGRVTLSQTQALATLPTSAIFEEAGQSYVFTVEDGQLAKRAVALGPRDEASGMTALARGVAEGTPVVRVRMPGLKAGAAAVLRPQPAPAAATQG